MMWKIKAGYEAVVIMSVDLYCPSSGKWARRILREKKDLQGKPHFHSLRDEHRRERERHLISHTPNS